MNPPFRLMLILTLLTGILGTAGCTDLFDDAGGPGNESSTTPVSVAEYRQTLAQPEYSAKMIRMDSDVYNIGEVVEFVITNEKKFGDLSCSETPPGFVVRYQKGTGEWITRMGDDNPAPGNATNLKPGESTAPFRFVTDGWSAGRYRIVTDCGVSREILLRALPTPTPETTPCSAGTDMEPYIRINPVSDQYTGEVFRISGTTNLPPGEELRYSLFAIMTGIPNTTSARLVSSTTTVSEGNCGTNIWYVEGVIAVPGDYFIGISRGDNTVSAIKRFTVLGTHPTVTATIPEKSTDPGITT